MSMKTWAQWQWVANNRAFGGACARNRGIQGEWKQEATACMCRAKANCVHLQWDDSAPRSTARLLIASALSCTWCIPPGEEVGRSGWVWVGARPVGSAAVPREALALRYSHMHTHLAGISYSPFSLLFSFFCSLFQSLLCEGTLESVFTRTWMGNIACILGDLLPAGKTHETILAI